MSEHVACEYLASVRISGAAKALREVAFKSIDAADRWLDQQRAIAKRAGWGGLTFERQEKCRGRR
jgi:hypothetical protein